MLIGQVEKQRNHTNLYQSCLVCIKITLVFNQFLTSLYIVFFEYGIYPKNMKGDIIYGYYENSSCICKIFK